jgi:NitT/TauT family transport system ATP-binding protein
MPDADIALHVHDVVKDYGEKRVLDGIHLKVAAGERCALVGPSGCGKSTFFRLILGQERPTSGEIKIDGVPVGPPSTDRGVVFQRYSLFPHLTALENVVLGKRLSTPFFEWLRRKKQFEEEAMAFLSRVGLDHAAEKYPHELSGGMQQRVSVVQSLIMKPKVLLLDEPFGALDPGMREDIQLFLLELWEQQPMTYFLVTHDLEEAVFLGSRLLVLSQYYTDDRGDGPEVKRGAKIVTDLAISADRKAFPTMEKYSQNFNDLLIEIRREGFDPEYRQHVREFDLKHPHSLHPVAGAGGGASS